MKKTSIFAVLVIMAVASISALAVEYYWNVASGDWSVGANWDPAGPPATNAWAIIDNGGTANIDTNIAHTAVAQIRVYDGTIEQTDYDVALTYLIMGAANGVATYNMSGGTLSTVYEVQIGKEADSTSYFNLSGGTVDFKSIAMGFAEDSYSIFTVTGGVLNTENDIILGQNSAFGDAILTQQGGEINVGDPTKGNLYISYYYDNPFGSDSGSGIYQMEGGLLNVGQNIHVGSDDGTQIGLLSLKGGEIVVGQNLIVHSGSAINDDGTLPCVGTKLKVWGDFINESSNNANFSMVGTNLLMMGGGAGWVPEAGIGGEWQYATLDMGNVVDYGDDYQNGLTDNFAIGNLVFHGSDTGSVWYMVESDIYCYGLVIEEGAVVILGGGNIYYMPENAESWNGIEPCTHLIAGTVYEVGGSLIELTAPVKPDVVPEPGTIVLIGSGVLGLAAVLRRKYC